MSYTKNEVQEELMNFMKGFAESIQRLYGNMDEVRNGQAAVSDFLGDEKRIRKSWLWNAVNEMYDYGIEGKPNGALGNGKTVDGSHADVEMFIRGLDSLELYLDEDSVPLPKRCMTVVRTAVARHVLEGGERYTQDEDGAWDYLSLPEVALLADMEERSVRNAANPKLADPLKTVSVGKRTGVTIEEARRWLVGRKGFVPTKTGSEPATERLTSIALPESTAQQLEQQAEAIGLSVAEFIAQQINAQ